MAIEGAKYFGRFEAFFLPQSEWGRVREDYNGQVTFGEEVWRFKTDQGE